MSKNIRQAILVASFGTSFEHTRRATIDAIERAIGESFPDCRIYRAWTSRMILAKLKKRDGLHIDNVSEAMARMAADGITDVVVQPTHVINGIESNRLREEVLSLRGSFRSIRFGAPLLTSDEDRRAVIDAVHSEFSPLKEDEALVLIGHGTAHDCNSIYADLDSEFRRSGSVYVGTVEAQPSMEQVIEAINARRPRRVILAPLMIVAGDHAQNDIAGDAPGSWASRFSSEGYEVEPVVKGLGEYESIRRLFVRHVAEALQASP